MASIRARVARVSASLWLEKTLNDPEPTQIGETARLKAFYAPNPARPGQFTIVLAEAHELKAELGREGEYFYRVEIPGVWSYDKHVGPLLRGGGVILGAMTDIPDDEFEALLAQQTLEDTIESINPPESRLGGSADTGGELVQ